MSTLMGSLTALAAAAALAAWLRRRVPRLAPQPVRVDEARQRAKPRKKQAA